MMDDNDTSELPLWIVDSSRYSINDKFLKVRVDACTTPQGGKVDTYYVLEYDDWVNCIAIDREDNVIMLRHYRHGVQKYLMEFIGGGIEPTDLSPEAAARRELEEEAGYTGGRSYHVGTSFANPANHTNKIYTFLVVDGEVTRRPDLEAGETLQVTKIPFKNVIEAMSRLDTTYPAIYVAALFHAMNFVRSSDDAALARLKKYV